MSRIESYIPEIDFFEGKQLDGCRIFHDDCAIVSTENDFPVIASRGFSLPTGTPFFRAVSTSATEMSKLQAFLQDPTPCLLMKLHRHTLIVFSALLRHTGLLVILRVPYSAQAVKRAMKNEGRDAFFSIFRTEDTSDRETITTHEHISEIFYYTDRILHETPALDLTARIRLIAKFVGCRVESLVFPNYFPIAERRRTDILIAFFLCIFLILRQHTGENTILKKETNVGKVQEESADVSPSLCIRLKHSPIRKAAEKISYGDSKIDCEESIFKERFLSLPCFENIFHFTENGDLVFEVPMYLPFSSATIGAQGALQCILIFIGIH